MEVGRSGFHQGLKLQEMIECHLFAAAPAHCSQHAESRFASLVVLLVVKSTNISESYS